MTTSPHSVEGALKARLEKCIRAPRAEDGELVNVHAGFVCDKVRRPNSLVTRTLPGNRSPISKRAANLTSAERFED